MQIALQNIHKEFARRDGARLLVLRDVSLTVGAEEFCCLVGASGSGKSTLLNILAGLTSPDAGQVLVGDSRLDSRRPRIGYVFQTPRLLNWKSVADNVAFAVRAAGVPADQARARARQYLGLVGLDQFIDELTARTLRAELLRIWQRSRKPVIFVTHNATEAVYLADRVLVLSGRPATILKTVPVGVPRDRQMEDPRLLEIQRVILDTLGCAPAEAVRH